MYCQYSSRSQLRHFNNIATAAICYTRRAGTPGFGSTITNDLCDRHPRFPCAQQVPDSQNNRVYNQNRKMRYIWRYTRLAVKNHWSRATRLVLDGTIRLVGVATYASVVHGPYSDERSARCDSTRVKILRHAHKALSAATSPKEWVREPASDVG